MDNKFFIFYLESLIISNEDAVTTVNEIVEQNNCVLFKKAKENISLKLMLNKSLDTKNEFEFLFKIQ